MEKHQAQEPGSEECVIDCEEERQGDRDRAARQPGASAVMQVPISSVPGVFWWALVCVCGGCSPLFT